MERRFEGQTVVVTGASAGIGRALVRALAAEGAQVGLLARGRDGLDAAVREVEATGGRAVAVPVDVADHDQVERAAARIEADVGPIDIWINNAMVSVFSPIRDLEPEELRRVTDVTYHGYVWGTMAALRRMLPRDRGTIVQVASALAYRGIPLQAAYCGAKHAIQGFCDSLWSELLHDGSSVRLRVVNLPAVNTPQFDWSKSRMPRRAQPLGTIFQPELAAEAILWAALHDRRELNVAWPATQAIVGNSFLPGLGDLYLARTAYEGQQAEEREPPDRPSNLWEPLPGDHGAHGRFDDRAKSRSAWLDISLNRSWILALAAAGGAAIWALNSRRTTR